MRTFKINNTVVTIDPNWTINHQLNSMSTGNFLVIDTLALPLVQVGQSVEFTDGTNILFGGFIKRLKFVDDEFEGVFQLIQCVDNNHLATKMIVSETGTNAEVSTIVKDVIIPYLEDDGVTEGNIVEGQTISKYTFNNIYVDSALDKLSEITNYNWDIDKDKKLNFFPITNVPAPFSITDSSRIHKAVKENDLSNYRNVQYMKAGKGKTDQQEDEKPTPEPDGVSRTFVLNYLIAEKPSISVNSSPISADDIGVRGVDEGKKWYYKIGENTINQDDSETILTSSDLLEVTYVGLFDILILAENEQEISSRASIEGGSGRYESIIQEQSFTEEGEALEYAQGLLDKYAEVADIFEFKTYEGAGLEVGQTININRTKYGIDSDFLISTINLKRYNQERVEYHVKAVDGASLGGWEAFFKALVNTQQTFVVNENEALVKLLSIDKEVVTMSDSLTVESGTAENRIGFLTLGGGEIGLGVLEWILTTDAFDPQLTYVWDDTETWEDTATWKD